MDYFKLTGKTLLDVADETTEAVHSRYRSFDERHGYVYHQKGSPIHKIKQHKSVVHYNSLNLGDI